MSLFPFFIDLKDKKCVVVGGGAVAERKIAKLLEFNPVIEVISLSVNKKILDLKENNKVSINIKEYNCLDLIGAFLVIAATDDHKTNEKVYRNATEKGILVNVVDCPEKCSFIFPSIVKRGDLVIGISTSASYPALSKKIRKKLEMIFPEEYDSYLDILGEFRVKSKRMISDESKRAQFLTRILEFLDQGITSLEEFKNKVGYIFKEYVDEEDF